MMDRFFDNHVMTPMQKMVLDAIRAAENRDRQAVAEARELLDTAYRWLNDVLPITPAGIIPELDCLQPLGIKRYTLGGSISSR